MLPVAWGVGRDGWGAWREEWQGVRVELGDGPVSSDTSAVRGWWGERPVRRPVVVTGVLGRTNE